MSQNTDNEQSEEPVWQVPRTGFPYRIDTVVVTPEQQREKLGACGIDASVFGEAVDPSFYIGLAIHAGITSGISAEGNVNMLQSLVMHRPARLDETLIVRGEIRAVTEVPRGLTVDTDVWFEDADGARVITAGRRSLKPDPDKAGSRGAGDRPAPVVTDVSAFARLDHHQLTPEQVKSYSSEGNSIHYEMAAANAAGFRAPLIGGGMGVHYLMAAIWRDEPPQVLDFDIYFRRPIFWDDAFFVAIDPARQAMCLVSEERSKVLTEARINVLGRNS